MDFKTKEIQQQYQGFVNTHFLWKSSFYGLKQIQLAVVNDHAFEAELTKNTRLGKRVESFVSCYLQQIEEISIVQENIQIQKEQITIGELDCILNQEQIPIHLEIVYKFYLYDTSVGATEIEHWIGPNRNDSLVQKIEKLSTKQLPLLYREETKSYVNVDIQQVQQKVFFKAQLFVPYANQEIVFEQLNSDCVCGFYIYQHELDEFSDCKFYIPTELNWLLEPHTQAH